jgi:Pyruvate/2-oxoacid:ferredoxin oxidoreductase gamma subunit
MGGLTSSTPFGQLEQTMDICQTVAVNGASFTARTTSFDKSLPEMLVAAIQNEGFSLVDIWELCTAYYVPNNRFTKSMLLSTLDQLGFKTGILQHTPRAEYTQAYRESVASQAGKSATPAHPIQARYRSDLDKRMGMVIAGAAGKKINSAAALFCRAAVLSDLWVSQRNDYPVTVKSGHSVSEVILSPEQIGYTGITKPEVLFLLFKEGLPAVKSQLDMMDEQGVIYANSELLPIHTRARVVPLGFKQSDKWAAKKEYWVIIALARLLLDTNIFPLDAFKEAVSGRAEFADNNLRAIEFAVSLFA